MMFMPAYRQEFESLYLQISKSSDIPKSSQKWLDNNEYSMKIMVSGTKIAVHMWQHQKIMDYAYVAGHLPPLNKSTW